MSAARRSGRAHPISADVSIQSQPRARTNLRDAHHSSPTGPCNFRHLSAGHVCGCRRFWATSRSSAGRADAQDDGQNGASCICGHHGCFHDLGHETADGLSRQQRSPLRLAIPSIETPEAIEAGRTSQPVHSSSRIARRSPEREGVGQLGITSPAAIAIDSQPTASARSQLHLRQHARQASRSNRSSATEIASTPILTAWLESRTATKSTFDIVKSGLRNLDIGETAVPRQWLRGTSVNSIGAGSKRDSRPRPSAGHLHEQMNQLKALVLSIPDVQHALSGIYQRLDAIESMSSSQEVPEDLAERLELLEHLEVRTLELETKLNSLDTAGGSFHDDHPMIDTSQRRNSDEQSDVLLERLDDIEHRLMRIEGHTLPNTQSPWSVEVVVLPWGAELHGLWFPDTTDSAWVQMVRSSSCHSDERLRPRACGPSHGDAGLVYSRLLSCGLIRVVQFIDNSAYHIQSQVHSAFSDILQSLSSIEQDRPSFQARLKEQFLGLQSALIPLRKIHRQSTLEYLSPAEMVTPVLWTASFLESSVFMKAPRAGIRRLYMTTPNGYVQPSLALGSLSWAILRALSTANGGTPQHTASTSHQPGDHDCWAWNRRLDPPPAESTASLHNASNPQSSRSSSPFETNSVISQRRGIRTSLQHQPGPITLPDIKHEPISDEDITYMPITPTSIFPSSQSHSKHSRKQSPTHQPSNSPVPTSRLPSRSAPSSQKRALTSSFDSYASAESGQSRASNSAGPAPQAYHLKRQRSKKRTRHAHQLSPLTHTQAEPGETPRQGSSSNFAQARAAAAYATPYSWNPAEESLKGHGHGRCEYESGDTDPLTSSPSAGSESDDVDDPRDQSDDDDDDDDDERNTNDRAVTEGVQSGTNNGSARRAAQLSSPLTPKRLTDKRGEDRARYEHAEGQDSAVTQNSVEEYEDVSEDDSMDEIGIEDEDDAMSDDDAMMDDEASEYDDFDDDDDGDDDDNDEMTWR